jgi:hypothetical protein
MRRKLFPGKEMEYGESKEKRPGSKFYSFVGQVSNLSLDFPQIPYLRHKTGWKSVLLLNHAHFCNFIGRVFRAKAQRRKAIDIQYDGKKTNSDFSE